MFCSRISSFPAGWPSRAAWLRLSWPCLLQYLLVATFVLTLSPPISDLYTWCNKVPSFSWSRAQVYRIGSLHPPRHPLIVFVLRDTHYNLYCRPIFCVFSHWVCSDCDFLCYYTDQDDRGGMFLRKVWRLYKIILALTTQRTSISIILVVKSRFELQGMRMVIQNHLPHRIRH
jgi:hypothetical protein